MRSNDVSEQPEVKLARYACRSTMNQESGESVMKLGVVHLGRVAGKVDAVNRCTRQSLCPASFSFCGELKKRVRASRLCTISVILSR